MLEFTDPSGTNHSLFDLVFVSFRLKTFFFEAGALTYVTSLTTVPHLPDVSILFLKQYCRLSFKSLKKIQANNFKFTV